MSGMKLTSKFNYGDDNPLDIPEEEFLSARPPALTPEQIVAMEIEPPDWALSASSKRGGRRQTKRPNPHAGYTYNSIVPAGSASGSYSPMVPLGPGRPPLPLTLGGRLNSDEEEIFHRSMDKRRRKQQQQAEAAERRNVPAGNLKNDDYRFWRGYTLSNEQGAQCKWCNGFYKTHDDMIEHHVKGSCKDRLLALYKYAKRSQQHYCFACKKQTGHSIWGIPLCNKGVCIGRWKFHVTGYLVGFVQYLEWAKELQETDPANGPFSHLKPEFSENGTSC